MHFQANRFLTSSGGREGPHLIFHCTHLLPLQPPVHTCDIAVSRPTPEPGWMNASSISPCKNLKAVALEDLLELCLNVQFELWASKWNNKCMLGFLTTCFFNTIVQLICLHGNIYRTLILACFSCRSDSLDPHWLANMCLSDRRLVRRENPASIHFMLSNRFVWDDYGF